MCSPPAAQPVASSTPRSTRPSSISTPRSAFGRALLGRLGTRPAAGHDDRRRYRPRHHRRHGRRATSSAQVKVDADRWQIDRLSVADLGGAAFSASGRMTLAGPVAAGHMRLDLDAHDMSPVTALLARFAPRRCTGARPQRARHGAGQAARAIHARRTEGRPSSALKAALARCGGAQRRRRIPTPEDSVSATMRLTASSTPTTARRWWRCSGSIPSSRSDTGAGALTLDASGPARGDWRIDGRLTAAGLDATASGTVSPFARQAIGRRCARPSRAPMSRRCAALGNGRCRSPLRPASRLSANDLSLSDIDATVAGATLRGKVCRRLGARRIACRAISTPTASTRPR